MVFCKEAMMKFLWRVLITVSALIFILTIFLGDARSEEDRIRAKIGIQIKSGDRMMRAKSRDRLIKDDMLRIYVHPEKSCYVYVVHADDKEPTLLNMVEQKVQGSTLVMPSLDEYYQVDGNSPKESFTIIVSHEELTDITNLFNDNKVSLSKWEEMEKRLIQEGKIDLSEKTEKPFPLAGNVRGAGPDDRDPFMRDLQIYSGKSVLVKRYEFRVKR